MKFRWKDLSLLGVWLLLFAIFSVALPNTFANNYETLIRQTLVVGAAAIGMTFIIISGEIDLSVGSLVALVTVVIAWCLSYGHMSPVLAALVGIVVGIVGAACNGAIVTAFKVNSFIVTLGSMLVLRGIAKWVADEKKIDAPMTFLGNLTAAVPKSQAWKLLPSGGWILLVLALGAAWVLGSTVFGRHVVATGSNPQTALLCGIRTGRVRIITFALAGLMYGVSGLLLFSRLTVGDPTVAVGQELNVIAAVVIGGASLSGGEGSIFGSLVGALIMSTISSGANQLGWPNFVQEIVTGVIILGAVAFDRYRARRALS